MIGDTSLPVPSARRWSLPQVAVLCAIAGPIVIRAIEMPATPLGIGRFLFSLATVALVYVTPYQTFLRRAFLAMIAEAIFGFVAFALVDIPFVADHRAQIGVATFAIADSIERIEAAFAHGVGR